MSYFVHSIAHMYGYVMDSWIATISIDGWWMIRWLGWKHSNREFEFVWWHLFKYCKGLLLDPWPIDPLHYKTDNFLIYNLSDQKTSDIVGAVYVFVISPLKKLYLSWLMRKKSEDKIVKEAPINKSVQVPT